MERPAWVPGIAEDAPSRIEVNQFEEVMQIDMSRLPGRKPRYWVAAWVRSNKAAEL